MVSTPTCTWQNRAWKPCDLGMAQKTVISSNHPRWSNIIMSKWEVAALLKLHEATSRKKHWKTVPFTLSDLSCRHSAASGQEVEDHWAQPSQTFGARACDVYNHWIGTKWLKNKVIGTFNISDLESYRWNPKMFKSTRASSTKHAYLGSSHHPKASNGSYNNRSPRSCCYNGGFEDPQRRNGRSSCWCQRMRINKFHRYSGWWWLIKVLWLIRVITIVIKVQ